MNTPRCFGKMKHRAKNARCYTAIMFVIETSNRQAGMVQPRAAAALLGRFASSQAAHPSPPGKPEVSVVSLLLLPHAKANLCMGTHVQRKRPRPRKENRLVPYPTTTQPHSRVPYRTGQNGHAFPRNPARQTLATWAYVAATMLCCSTFHARDVEDAAPYKAFARRSRLILTAQRSGTRSESADVDAQVPSD